MPGNIPDEIWLFRIVHIDNLPFLLERGMYASTHPDKDPDYVFIGDTKLTEQRSHYPIPLEGRGHIGEYVAFYFGHLSPMLYNRLDASGQCSGKNELFSTTCRLFSGA